jgi:hypothetical protein
MCFGNKNHTRVEQLSETLGDDAASIEMEKAVLRKEFVGKRKLTKAEQDDLVWMKRTLNDEQLVKTGPVGERAVTDKCFLPVVAVAMLALFIISVYGWATGNPRRLIIGWDSEGSGCGYSEKTKDYPYLYWPQMPNQALVD